MDKRILVIPAFSGAGASFVASALAFSYAAENSIKKPAKSLYNFLPLRPQNQKGNKISLIEPCGEDFFLSAALEEALLLGEFHSYCKALEDGSSLKNIQNMRKGVNCLFRIPKKDNDLSISQLFRLLNSAPGNIRIFDASSLDKEILKDAAAEVDVRILVIDPKPVKLISACKFLSSFLLRFPDTLLVVNKMNSGVHKNQLKQLLGNRSYYTLPMLSAELEYKAQYNGLLFSELFEVQELLKDDIKKIHCEIERI